MKMMRNVWVAEWEGDDKEEKKRIHQDYQGKGNKVSTAVSKFPHARTLGENKNVNKRRRKERNSQRLHSHSISP